MWELGLFGGLFLASDEHDLYDPDSAGAQPLWRVAPDVGLRLGYFPLRPLGVELDFDLIPTRSRTITNDLALVYGFGGHAVVQLPFYSVVPFFVVGGGLLGIRSHIATLGNDVDPAFRYGGGIKVMCNRWVAARVDVRSNVSAAANRQRSGTQHLQILFGLTFTLGRAKEVPVPPPVEPPDPDRDKDGILNERDQCPDKPGVAPHGCPDTDGDGFRDDQDACPEVAGVHPDGCPAKDTDKDGINDPLDKCVEEPETWNGYEDEDGCPDELPAKVKEFSGTIEGIAFDFNKDTIRPSSTPTLDRAVETLKEYPDIKVKIIGHTDDVGSHEFNVDLSRRRAEAVRDYLIKGGVEPVRVTTEGRGPAEPVAPNDSEENRAKNRRIEFQIVWDRPAPASQPTERSESSGAPPRQETPTKPRQETPTKPRQETPTKPRNAAPARLPPKKPPEPR
jgi:outer membrane protein OmpA-like peptidoglycan-associated protein